VCGGALVKSLRCCLILIILGLSSTVALANGIDPVGKVLGGDPTLVLLTANDPNFQGTVTKGTSNFVSFGFINGTGFTAGAINEDVINTSILDILSFSTDNTSDPYFDQSTPPLSAPVSVSPGEHVTLSFFGTTTHPGLASANCTSSDPTSCTPPAPFNTMFFVAFDITDMTVGDSFHFQGSFVPIPEPATILLVLAGGVLFPFFKRS
jgi:hypothetical protein